MASFRQASLRTERPQAPRRRLCASAAWLVPLSLLTIASAAFADPAPAPAPAKSGKNQDVVVTAIRRQQPADAPPPLEAYAKPPKFGPMAVSDDASQVAFVTTYDGMRLLVTYRFADKSRRYAKLATGDISSLAFADQDHVLVTTTRPAPRGTCLVASEANAISDAESAGANIAADQAATPPANAPPGEDLHGVAADIVDSVRPPSCVFFGVRAQSSVISVNMANNTGQVIGDHLGDHHNLPLGAPQPVSLDGQRRLMGPFMEIRTQAIAGQPTERAYLWSVDPETGLGRLINDGGGDLDRLDSFVDDWLVDPQGQILARSVYDYNAARFAIEMKVGGRWKAVLTRKINPKEHTFAPVMVGLAADGPGIVIMDTAKGQAGAAGLRVFHYYVLSPDGSLSAQLETGDAARDKPLFSPDTGRLEGFVQRGETDTYMVSDPALADLYQQAQDTMPDEAVRVVATAKDPHKMIIHTQGRDDPGAYYFVDFTTGETDTIGEDYAAIPTSWIATQSQISYKAADGLEIHALLTLPPKPKPDNLPLVVLPHDGPQSHDALGFDWLAQALASRGYVVLQPNYRGSDGYGPDFIAAGYGQIGGKMQSDLSDGVRYLVSEGVADPKRVCVLGVGYGGFAALTAAADEPAVYRCAGAVNGVTDLAAYATWQKAHQDLPEQDQITNLAPDPNWPRAFKANPASPAILAAYQGASPTPSPVAQAGRISAPVLLVHEIDDRIAPVRQSQAMRDALQGAGKSVDYVEIKGADHALTSEASRNAALTAVIAFLAKANPAD